jgi:hypothetical protein
VNVGTALGLSDIASVTTSTLAYRTVLEPGSYWIRKRAATGGAVGAWSNNVQIPIGSDECSEAPASPILLPVTTTSDQATFTWWPSSVETATSYMVRIASGGRAPELTLTTVGTSANVTWPNVHGNFVAYVVAHNGCGTSPPANGVAFSVP